MANPQFQLTNRIEMLFQENPGQRFTAVEIATRLDVRTDYVSGLLSDLTRRGKVRAYSDKSFEWLANGKGASNGELRLDEIVPVSMTLDAARRERSELISKYGAILRRLSNLNAHIGKLEK